MALSITPALVIINMQEDYAKFEQKELKEISFNLNELMKSGKFGTIVAIQQWYPMNHVSFAESHPSYQELDVIGVHGRSLTLVNRHCVAGTKGADLLNDLPWDFAHSVIRTGTDHSVPAYSAFREGWNERAEQPTTGLGGYLRSRGVSEVYLAGLFRELEVQRSAEDGAAIGFKMNIIWDVTKALCEDKNDDVKRALRIRGVRLATSGDILGS